MNFTQAVQNHYHKMGAECGYHGVIVILSSCNEIYLDMPKDGIEKCNGWNLLPLSNLRVRMQYMIV